jgi:hypothetical protein
MLLKKLFALVIKISFGGTPDFRVMMWETSLPEDKLAGDLGNVIEATSIRRSSVSFFKAGKLASGNLGLFQQHRPISEVRVVHQRLAGCKLTPILADAASPMLFGHKVASSAPVPMPHPPWADVVYGG